MKIKKLAALAMTCAMVVTGGSLFAACGDDDGGKGGFVEDTRIWYAVGNSEKGILKENAWDFQKEVDGLILKRDTTQTDKNVFTLKLDIYAGDSFKFVYRGKDEVIDTVDTLYAREVGINNVEGVIIEDSESSVKSGNDVLFKNGTGLDTKNLICQKGQDGKYTIKMETFPEQGTDEQVKLSITKDEAITIPYDMYVYGDMNAFGWKDVDDYAMTSSNGVWSMKLTVGADDLARDASGAKVSSGAAYAAIQLVNKGEGAAASDAKKFALAPASGDKFLKVTDSAEGEINLLPEGKWVITFTEEGKVVSIVESAYEMYLIGSFNEWKTADADYAMTEQSDGSWTAKITVTKDEKIKSYNKLGLNDQDKYSAGADVPITAGTWAVKYNPETNTIQVEKLGYHIVGRYADMTDTTGWQMGLAAGKAVALEDKGEGVYSADIELAAGNSIKVVYGSVIAGPVNWYGIDGSDANFDVSEAATYTVTVTVTNDSVVVKVAKKA